MFNNQKASFFTNQITPKKGFYCQIFTYGPLSQRQVSREGCWWGVRDELWLWGTSSLHYELIELNLGSILRWNINEYGTTRMPAFWDTPCCLMITHTSDSQQIPNQNKTSQNYKFKKIAKNSNFEILQGTLHTTHFLKWFDKIINMNWIQTKL